MFVISVVNYTKKKLGKQLIKKTQPHSRNWNPPKVSVVKLKEGSQLHDKNPKSRIFIKKTLDDRTCKVEVITEIKTGKEYEQWK